MVADAAKSRQVLIYRSRLRRVFIFNGNASAKYSEKNITVVIFDYILGEERFHDGRNSPEQCSQGREGDRYGNVFIDKRIEWR